MKRVLRELLERRDLDAVARLAETKKRVLQALVSLTYDPDETLVCRAIEALGMAAERVAEVDPDYVLGQLRRLRWLVNDESGAVCWHAPEAMAEIVRRRPSDFADYVPIIVTLLREMEPEDLEAFRPAVLWAIGRLGPVAAAEIDAVLPEITACLDDPSPRVRGLAVWCLEQTGRTEALPVREAILADEATFDLFEGGRIQRLSVGQIFRRATANDSARGPRREDRPA